MKKKGSNAERELIKLLWKHGYAVVRSAGSGLLYAPDVIAVKNGNVYAFEVKAWKREEVVISPYQWEKMIEWSNRAGADLFLAWKYPYKGWFFIPVRLLEKRNGYYRIRINEAEALSYNSFIQL